jgi:cation transport regulator ChaC
MSHDAAIVERTPKGIAMDPNRLFSALITRRVSAWCGRRAAIEQRMDERFVYFAYGSNMLTRRVQARTTSARAEAVGHVVGRRLTFSKRSDDGSGKADAELMNDAADQVEGVMFSIETAQKQALEEAEGVGRGYEESYVDVVTAKGDRAGACVCSERRRHRSRTPAIPLVQAPGARRRHRTWLVGRYDRGNTRSAFN